MASLRSVLPIAILLSIRHISLHSCQSSWSVHESSVAVQKAAHLDNHLLCRIAVHSCRMPLLTAQFSPIVNTEPEKHTTEVPKWELPERLAIRRWRPAKNISGALGIRTLSYRALSLRAVRWQSPALQCVRAVLGRATQTSVLRL